MHEYQYGRWDRVDRTVRTCDQNRTGKRPKRRISITANMPPHPEWISREQDYVYEKELRSTEKEDTPAREHIQSAGKAAFGKTKIHTSM